MSKPFETGKWYQALLVAFGAAFMVGMATDSVDWGVAVFSVLLFVMILVMTAPPKERGSGTQPPGECVGDEGQGPMGDPYGRRMYRVPATPPAAKEPEEIARDMIEGELTDFLLPYWPGCPCPPSAPPDNPKCPYIKFENGLYALKDAIASALRAFGEQEYERGRLDGTRTIQR